MEHLFFKAAFKNDEQNNLKEHDFELIRQFYIDQIEEKATGKYPTSYCSSLRCTVRALSL